jgi:glycosyltransferase involved in cell wall biosynthesis
MKLSIVIPVYNEAATILALLKAVTQLELPGVEKEVLVVDDGSTDGTAQVLELSAPAGVRVLTHARNQGKGAALRTGFSVCSGDVVVVQDADLEYDPRDLPRLLQPIRDGRADVVYGSRFIGSQCHRVHMFWHMVGNRLITLMSNMFSNLNLTDVENCYKMFRRDVLRNVTLREDRFGFEIEITARIAKLKCRVYETGISYYGRSYEEGKKAGWKDGVRALYCVLRYNVFGR